MNSMVFMRCFRIYFFQLEQHSIAHTISLPVCKNHTIHCMTFILVLNNAENIPLSKKIVVHASFAHIPPPSSEDTYSWLAEVVIWL